MYLKVINISIATNCRVNRNRANPTPSSTRYCRPIQFMYNTEMVEITYNEVEKVEKEISELKPFKLNINNKNQEVGLKVDRGVQGMGTSNTGNVARRFFKNSRI
ncbi:unnamed protein product [Macrosiphum euphorbiae]|uniref:Uncharacterized protein n=1 Tax=Macrosiphum euphorbiae TaxID=13131 RepID=A0AAV0Y078_9HEMI|nr:unnamed protein product [Macrosiphum euphorbiae]